MVRVRSFLCTASTARVRARVWISWIISRLGILILVNGKCHDNADTRPTVTFNLCERTLAHYHRHRHSLRFIRLGILLYLHVRWNTVEWYRFILTQLQSRHTCNIFFSFFIGQLIESKFYYDPLMNIKRIGTSLTMQSFQSRD